MEIIVKLYMHWYGELAHALEWETKEIRKQPYI